MIKVLLVVPDSIVGGVTSSAVNFANEVSSRGNEVFFLDMSSQISNKNLLNSNVKIVELSGKSINWCIGVGDIKKASGLGRIKLATLGIIKKLAIKSGFWYKLIFSQFLDYGDFDVAIAYRQCDPCYSFVLHKVNAKKKIAFVHGELKYMGDISSWKKHMTSFDKVAYVSSAVKEQFVTVYPELARNACTIYNMFDVDKIRHLSKERPVIDFDKNIKNIVTVARIDNAFKQIDWIVEICEQLKIKTKVPFHWYIIGDGSDFDNTVEFAKQKEVDDVVTFVGQQDNPYTFMKQSDFTVLTSKSESYGMVVTESLILHVPVVVAEYPALKEIIKDYESGRIVEQSIEALSNCILEMLEDKSSIRTNCTQYLKNYNYTNDVAYNQFLEALD